MENNVTDHKSRKILLLLLLGVLLVGSVGIVFLTKNKNKQPPSQKAAQPKVQSSIYFVPSTVNPNTPINSTQSAQLIVKPESAFNAMSIQFKFDPHVVKEIEVIPTQYKTEKLRPYTIKSSAIDYEHGLVTLRFNQSDGTENIPLKRGIKVADVQYQLAQPLTKSASLFIFTGRTAMLKKIDKTQVASTDNTTIQNTSQTQYESILNSAPPLKVSQ